MNPTAELEWLYLRLSLEVLNLLRKLQDHSRTSKKIQSDENSLKETDRYRQLTEQELAKQPGGLTPLAQHAKTQVDTYIEQFSIHRMLDPHALEDSFENLRHDVRQGYQALRGEPLTLEMDRPYSAHLMKKHHIIPM